MSEIKAAAEAATHLAKQYRAVLDLVDVLNKVGDLDNYIASAQGAFDKAKEDLVTVQTSYKLAKAKLDNKQAEYEKLKQEIFTTLEVHSQNTNTIYAKAETDVKQIIADAYVQAQKIVDEATAKERASKERLAELNKQGLDAQYHLDALTADIANIKSKFQ